MPEARREAARAEGHHRVKRRIGPRSVPFLFDPIPRVFIEQWLPYLSHAELLVYLYICHRTWGFRKKQDAVSIEQICRGIVNDQGLTIDVGTGLSERHARRAAQNLSKMGLLDITVRRNRPNLYAIKMNWAALDLPCHRRQGKNRSTLTPGLPRTLTPGLPTTREQERAAKLVTLPPRTA